MTAFNDYTKNIPDSIEIQPRTKVAPQKGPYGEKVITVDGLKADEVTQKVALKTLSTKSAPAPMEVFRGKTVRLDILIEEYTNQLLEELNKGDDCNVERATKLLQQLITAGHAANGVDWKIDANELDKILKEVTIKKKKNHQTGWIMALEIGGGIISIGAGAIGIGILAPLGLAAQSAATISQSVSYMGSGVSNLAGVGKSHKQGSMAVHEFVYQQMSARKEDRNAVFRKHFEDAKAQAQRIDGREQSRQGAVSAMLRS